MLSTETTFTGLQPSAPTPLSFAPETTVRSFLLRRSAGDLLIYGAPEVPEGAEGARHLLGHEHERMFLGDDTTAELPPGHQRLGDDVEVIPIPGHTPGSVAYLWDNGEHRFLFTADSVMLHRGEWTVAVLESSDPKAYVESLATLRELDFDVLVPWAAGKDQPFYAMTDRDDAHRRLTALIDRIRADARA